VRQRRWSCERWEGEARQRNVELRVFGCEREKEGLRSPRAPRPRLSPEARRSLLRLRRGAANRRRSLWGRSAGHPSAGRNEECAGRSEKVVPELVAPNAGRNLPIRIRRLPEVVNMGQLSPHHCVPGSRREPPARSREKSQADNRRRRRWDTPGQSSVAVQRRPTRHGCAMRARPGERVCLLEHAHVAAA